MQDARAAAAGAIGVAGLLTALWAWWALDYGGYFGTVFHPGAIGLYALLATLLLTAPWRARLRGAPAVALLALVGLGLWTALSMLWSPTRDSALQNAQQALLYAAAFGAGLWLCQLLWRRMYLALVPLALAGVVTAVVTAVSIGFADAAQPYLDMEATLDYPLGYRNATGLFFLLSLFAALTLASQRGFDWRLRAASMGGATLCLELVVLAQSRGTVLSGAVGLAVFIAVSRSHVRALVFSGLAALPALPALPALLDVFQAGEALRDTVPELHGAAAAIALTAGASILLGVVAARVDDGSAESFRLPAAVERGTAVGLAVVLLVGAGVLVAAEGGPEEFVEARAEEFTGGGAPEFGGSGARFGVNLQSERGDFWRVALDDVASEPLLGRGGGGFELSYLRERDSDQAPEDPHSVEMLMLSELGLPGFALFGAFLIAAGMGAFRARRLGPSAATLSLGAITATSAWLAQASVDWFWHYPALTAPVIGLLGAASAPFVLAPATSRPRGRLAVVAVITGVALTSIPPFLSDAYRDRALRQPERQRAAAYEDLERARDLNPFSEEPYLLEGLIALRAGERSRAHTAFSRAAEIEPENWAPRYFLGRLLAPRAPAVAARELNAAAELNPREDEVGTVLRKLRRAGARS